MKHLANDLHKKLLNLHKRFLENERMDAEKYFGKTLTPLEFLQMLTQGQNFAWFKPFSALILNIDELTEENEELSNADITNIREQIVSVLLGSDSESNLQKRYQHHLKNDPEFAKLHSALQNALGMH